MSFENPTPLVVGATGTLDGRHVRVAGRVVVGMEEDGGTYYWNEFNVVDSFGRAATLVFEQTDGGPEWKLFKALEPFHAMTAAEAANKSVGDTVNLDGTPARITLVDQSRVYQVEGTGPDGVEVGDVANYFNVDRGDRMLVASWTGDEIEFYEGRDLSGTQVAEAFGLPKEAATLRNVAMLAGNSSPTARSSNNGTGCVVIGLLALFGFFSCGKCEFNPTPRTTSPARAAPPPPPKKAASALRLANGAQGRLGQRTYRIESHALVEIARVGTVHDEHEYSLTGAPGNRTRLINGLNGGTREWHLLELVTGAPELSALTPHEAATRRKGAPVPLAGRTFRITSLFQARALEPEGNGANAIWPALQYGFIAQDDAEWLVARWTETGITFFRGRAVSETDVLAALGPGPEKPR